LWLTTAVSLIDQQHQSAGYLEINTQLSMERRRFILDAITRRSGQSVQEDLADICHRRKSRIHSIAPSTQAGGTATVLSSATISDPSTELGSMDSAFERALERKTKLAALADRQRSEVRFQALERVLTRNLKVRRPTRINGTSEFFQSRYCRVGRIHSLIELSA